MTDAYRVLETAISDVGYWCWWAEKLPELFQVEFGGVQLWNPPAHDGGPPSGVVALRFNKPSLVVFLTDGRAKDLAADWPEALHEDRLEPFTVSNDEFTLTSEELIASIAMDCAFRFVVGSVSDLKGADEPIRLGFRAGPVGLIVRAKQMVVISSSGELSSEQIIQASRTWWEYWNEYWRLRSTANPRPKDYACEVTIPLKND